ncbi:hypothetical protein BC829DRAFT_378460 [Chytridium lagenaria]|nr:hypothetical protein BC829DRAFT_378460 [Chytridium lagenaria]
MLTGPHQMLSVESGSSTIRLSFGERPFFAPELRASAPELIKAVPASCSRASSYSTGMLALWMMGLV